ncbi:HepT-like ribonuclease domain-containing protein [Rhodopseudomonas palustris]|nr:HepT-like ribonuclease domain-containing protein [Rhodopseudomonas palustris]WQH00098.1 HepT-like ribonuclease domain-containing protein [Rhodopseudomonas palustris]
MPPSLGDRLTHIATAIQNIRDALSDRNFSDLQSNPVLLAAVERFLERISEASRHIPEDFKRGEPTINWRRLADLGNWLRHGYHATDAGLLWEMVQRDLEPLQQFITRVSKEIDR